MQHKTKRKPKIALRAASITKKYPQNITKPTLARAVGLSCIVFGYITTAKSCGRDPGKLGHAASAMSQRSAIKEAVVAAPTYLPTCILTAKLDEMGAQINMYQQNTISSIH